jgi:hypothetical protein
MTAVTIYFEMHKIGLDDKPKFYKSILFAKKIS